MNGISVFIEETPETAFFLLSFTRCVRDNRMAICGKTEIGLSPEHWCAGTGLWTSQPPGAPFKALIKYGALCMVSDKSKLKPPHFQYYICIESHRRIYTNLWKELPMVYTDFWFLLYIIFFFFFNKKAVLILILKTKGKNWVSVWYTEMTWYTKI